jgi:hypothetical protein
VLERLSDFSLEKFFQTNSDISQGDFAIAWEAYGKLINTQLCLFTTDTGYVGSGHAHILRTMSLRSCLVAKYLSY